MTESDLVLFLYEELTLLPWTWSTHIKVRNIYFSHWYKVKQKYRGMFETQKSENKKSLGEIGLSMRTPANPKVGQDQVPKE